MIPRTLTFIFTLKCNIRCRHCSLNAHPLRQEVFKEQQILSLLDQAYDIPSIECVVFTGGEPTLYPNLLGKCIEYASKQGFRTRVVTNAWWAYSYEKAYRFLDELRSKGLDELCVSYSDFHADYIPLTNIVNAVRAAIDLNIKIALGIVLYRGCRTTASVLEAELRKAGLSEHELCSKSWFTTATSQTWKSCIARTSAELAQFLLKSFCKKASTY